MVDAKWIRSAIKDKGALRAMLHVKKDEPISAKKLEKATHSRDSILARRARLAETLSKLGKK